MNITEPLALSRGSHTAGSGKGCAMNVISWENGDTTITDMPACSDPMLARIVQRVNDNICDHTGTDRLCPTCSLTVLELGHRTVGTGVGLGISDDERLRVWVRVAAHCARQVAHLNPDPRVMAAIEAAEGWADGSVSADDVARASRAAAAYAATDATGAARAAAYTTAAAAAADAAADGMASTAIDKFAELTGHQTPTIDDTTINTALRNMVSLDRAVRADR